MNAESRLNGRCETCLSKNVQVVLNCEPLGQNRSKLFLRIASKHTSHSICAFLSKWCQECPSGLSNCPSGSYYCQLQNQEKKPVMIYAIYQYGLRMEAVGFLDMYMFWHLQFSVSGFAIFGDSLYLLNNLRLQYLRS